MGGAGTHGLGSRGPIPFPQRLAKTKLNGQLERNVEQREGVNDQCGSSIQTDTRKPAIQSDILIDEASDCTLNSGTQIDELFMPAESDFSHMDSTHISTIQLESSQELQPQPNLNYKQLDLQTDDDAWHDAEGVPRLTDPFIQQYLNGRDHLVAQEKTQRSGIYTCQLPR